MNSPFKNRRLKDWQAITKKLVARHPLSGSEIKDVALECWEEIFLSKIGKKPFHIGEDIFPKPQIMGFLLHELIPLEFERRYPKEWRKERTAGDKDLVYIPNDHFSIEIKTSSSPQNIFGNRSYAQEAGNDKKSKSGYYLAINFTKFTAENIRPKIVKVRFGWLDHEDWLGQKAATGQQARLSREVESLKLIVL